MTKIILDEALRIKLKNLSQPLELCDDTGRVVARVFPSSDLPDYEPCEPPISEKELRQREQSSDWYTTKEVLARLKELESQ